MLKINIISTKLITVLFSQTIPAAPHPLNIYIISSPARPQPHAVVPHYKQSNTFPMSLENHQQIYGYTCVYSISVSNIQYILYRTYCTVS
jgi:hypothetical protein